LLKTPLKTQSRLVQKKKKNWREGKKKECGLVGLPGREKGCAVRLEKCSLRLGEKRYHALKTMGRSPRRGRVFGKKKKRAFRGNLLGFRRNVTSRRVIVSGESGVVLIKKRPSRRFRNRRKISRRGGRAESNGNPMGGERTPRFRGKSA